ncbi:MAG: prevent-host-death protein [Lachnospiraceae bacterium]|nr:prevent-host-death protein [Lachnospiraceae bacterium]
MSNIKLIPDLRNYIDMLREVDISKHLYLTRNGHGEYGILTMDEIDRLVRCRTACTIFSNL